MTASLSDEAQPLRMMMPSALLSSSRTCAGVRPLLTTTSMPSVCSRTLRPAFDRLSVISTRYTIDHFASGRENRQHAPGSNSAGITAGSRVFYAETARITRCVTDPTRSQRNSGVSDVRIGLRSACRADFQQVTDRLAGKSDAGYCRVTAHRQMKCA